MRYKGSDFKVNDLIEVGRKWFMDNKVHRGRIAKISPDESRFEIISETYPKRFSISRKYCRRVKQLKTVEV